MLPDAVDEKCSSAPVSLVPVFASGRSGTWRFESFPIVGLDGTLHLLSRYSGRAVGG